MRRSSGVWSGSVTSVAVLVIATVALAGGFLLAGGGAATHATGVPLSSSHASPALGKPAAGPSSISVGFTNSFPTYLQMPLTLNWTIQVTGGTWNSASSNSIPSSTMFLQVRDVAPVCQGGYGFTHQCPGVQNIDLNKSVTSATSYSYSLTYAALVVPGPHPDVCPAGAPPCVYANGIFPNDQYQLFIFVNYYNGTGNTSASGEGTGYLITANPAATLLSPWNSTAGTVSTGNVAVAISYSGSYIAGASLDIYSGLTATGQPVYTQGLFSPGVGVQTVVAAVPWAVATAGNYTAVINLTTPYSTTFFKSEISVVSAGGGIVYENKTTYNNQTGSGGTGKIFGLTPQVAGTVLLVAGLIVGMIVAFALGMMMWGGSAKAASPAQPWQSKSGFECSVCHQTFATEQELKDHSKSAHGMT